MAELLGRKVTIAQGDTPSVIAVARTKSLTINNEAVDVTSDGDDGIQRYLNEPGQKAVEVSVEGMFDSADETLIDLSLSDDLISALEFDYTAYTIGGDFFMTSYSQSMAYNDAITFSATFASSGAVVKTTTP